MALGADRRYNFFFSPPANLCRHMYDWNIVYCDVKQPIYLSYLTFDNDQGKAAAKGGQVIKIQCTKI